MDLSNYNIIRRNNNITPFNRDKITEAIKKAFLEDPAYADKDLSFIEEITDEVIAQTIKLRPTTKNFNIEDIQNSVELTLMRMHNMSYFDIGRRYILYRQKRAEARAQRSQEKLDREIHVTVGDKRSKLDVTEIEEKIAQASEGLKNIDKEQLLKQALSEMYDGITPEELQRSLQMAASSKIEFAPEYSQVSARLLLSELKTEIFGGPLSMREMEEMYPSHLTSMLERGVQAKILSPVLVNGTFDLERLGRELRAERDFKFDFIGFKTLYDRYFVNINGKRIEMPQSFFMRVAMGLAIEEDRPTERAIQFYNVLSQFDFMTSTPTLFNSGCVRSQLSSCYLTTVEDSLEGIYTAYMENALLSKFAGGLGNDWTNIRSMGSYIAGTNGHSQGLVPFLKLVNDTAVAVNQCFNGETELMTGSGQFKKIKDLNEQDLVLGKDGEFCTLTEVHHYDYKKEKMLTLKTGALAEPEAINVTAGHPFWAVKNPDNKSPAEVQEALAREEMFMEWIPAKNLAVNDFIGNPIPKELVGDDKAEESDMRLFGLLLAEEKDIKISSPSAPAGQWFQKVQKYLTGKAPVAPAPEQYIEKKYMFLPKNKTQALLRGAFKNGNEFTTVERGLLTELRFQLLRLGILPTRVDYNNETETWRLLLDVELTAETRPSVGDGWFTSNGYAFSRLEALGDYQPPAPADKKAALKLYDLKVADAKSYWVTGALAHNGGKRKGAVCTYLETWHPDIEEYLDLRKNTGDDRRRTHDMNTANWVPDLFMKRVLEKGEWTLFSPVDAPDLHGSYGKLFEEKYLRYERMAGLNKIRHKKVKALTLWRKMLGMLYETGHPWITFKDPCNIRSPQQHVGVVHSSNLCTEITLNTNEEEIAVCNIGSINLVNHMKGRELDREKLLTTVTTAMRMLDNVIDINFYAVKKAEISNKRHRPVGLGMMGFQDCLYKMGVSYNSTEAIKFADYSTEIIAYMAYWASSDLAAERGPYKTYEGSLWSKGIMPKDTLHMLAKERGDQPEESSAFPFQRPEIDGEYLKIDLSQTMDWEKLREKIKKDGMRNSNCMAIAPTATIANIIGVTASIEPTFQNIYVKSNLSGEFTIVNKYIVEELRALNIWTKELLAELKYHDGDLQKVKGLPAELQSRYKTSFDIEPSWLIRCAAARQKWIDQAQSLNIYVKEPDGAKLHETYMLAWRKGLKTTYYLRTLSASTHEKYSTRTGAHAQVAASGGEETAVPATCSVDNPECEVCQ